MSAFVVMAGCALVVAALVVARRAVGRRRRRLRIVRDRYGRERLVVWAEEIMLSGFKWPVPDVPDKDVAMQGPCVDLTTTLAIVEGSASQYRYWYKSSRADPIPTGTSAHDHWYFGGDDLTYRDPTADLNTVERAESAAAYVREVHDHFMARVRAGGGRR